MKVAIYGLGYVGLTAAGCLAHSGHHVLGVEINEEKLTDLRAGRSPIVEPGLASSWPTECGRDVSRRSATLAHALPSATLRWCAWARPALPTARTI